VTEEREQRSMGLLAAVSTAARNGSLALAAVASWSNLLLVVQGRGFPGGGVSATPLILVLVLRRTLSRVGPPGRGFAAPAAASHVGTGQCPVC
jgi:hypothetical protein